MEYRTNRLGNGDARPVIRAIAILITVVLSSRYPRGHKCSTAPGRRRTVIPAGAPNSLVRRGSIALLSPALHEARRKPSSRVSHFMSWFQLAMFWSTKPSFSVLISRK